jgi:hypothetical protein
LRNRRKNSAMNKARSCSLVRRPMRVLRSFAATRRRLVCAIHLARSGRLALGRFRWSPNSLTIGEIYSGASAVTAPSAQSRGGGGGWDAELPTDSDLHIAQTRLGINS